MPRKSDALIQVWLDRRYIAAAAKWLDKNNYPPNSLAELFRLVFQGAINNLVLSGETELMSTAEAMHFLDGRFKANLNPQGKGLSNLTKNLQLSPAPKPNQHEEIERGAIEAKVKAILNKNKSSDKGNKSLTL